MAKRVAVRALVAVVATASLLALPGVVPAASAASGALVPSSACTQNVLFRNDDGSSDRIPLPFPINFLGAVHDSLFVNNNGNVTFDAPLSTFIPFALTATTPPLIAVFFADVDTRPPDGGVVSWGQAPAVPEVGGRAVFCAQWTAVGEFPNRTAQLNTFQLLLVDRSDVAAGDFDVYLNYDTIEWDHGGAGVGYSGGTGRNDGFLEFSCSRVPGACLDANLTTGLVNTSTNSTVLGRHILPIRGGGITFAGRLFGTVTSGGSPVGGAFVQACLGSVCRTTSTVADGAYEIRNLPPGAYDVRVSGPGQLRPQSRQVNVAGAPVQADFALVGPTPPPPGSGIAGQPPGQVPSIVVGRPVTIVATGCDGGAATFEIFKDGVLRQSGPMTEGAPGSYSGSYTPNFTGPAQVVIRIAGCPDVVFDIYIDPSGFVLDVAGNALVGATVTLLRSDTSSGPFVVVPDGSVIMSPSNRTNPDLTDSVGHFGWDVIAGFYRVRAERSGCTDPADASRAFVETETLTIPPPVFDLDLRLNCGPPPRSTPSISTQASPGNLLGAPVRDVATLTGGDNPTGDVTFRLFSDPGCTTQVFSAPAPVSGGVATSPWFVPAAAGTYHWTADYAGDVGNQPVSSPCGAPGESVTIAPFAPPAFTRTLGGDVVGPVNVAAGESVLIEGARVAGPVSVAPGGALTVVDAQVTRGITADAPRFLSICGSRISAPSPATALAVVNAPVPVRIGDPATGCAGNRFGGPVNLSANLAAVVGANMVAGGLTIGGGGPGATTAKANTLTQALACSGNIPAPTNAGQPNSAPAKTGQCAGL